MYLGSVIHQILDAGNKDLFFRMKKATLLSSFSPEE